MMQRRAVILCFNASPTPRQQNLFRLLREMGWRPAYVTWERSGAAKTVPRDNGDYLAVIRLKAPTESFRLLFAMPRYWRELSVVLHSFIQEKGVDHVIVATHFFHLPLARRFAKALWLYDAAEYFSISLSEYLGFMRLLARPFLYGLEGLGIRRMCAVLGVDSREGWFERFLKRFNKRVRIVPNVPALADDLPPNLISGASSRPDGGHALCYVGGIMERKGLDVTLTALKLLKQSVPNARLLIIGSYQGPIAYIGELLTKYELHGQVTIIELLPYQAMLARIASCEIGLALYQQHPLYERVGKLNARKIFTYMQAGLCVLAPSFGDIGRIVSEVDCGLLVNTEKPEAVAEALKRMLTDDELRARFKINSRQAFENLYNWEAVTRQLKPWLSENCESR